MQVPSNMLITKVKPGPYMSAWMLIWAVVSGKPSRTQFNHLLLTLALCSLRRSRQELRRPGRRTFLPRHHGSTFLPRSDISA